MITFCETEELSPDWKLSPSYNCHRRLSTRQIDNLVDSKFRAWMESFGPPSEESKRNFAGHYERKLREAVEAGRAQETADTAKRN